MSYRPAPTEPLPPRRAYPSDLTDEQWARIGPLLPGGGTRGKPRIWSLREIVDAMLYILHNGCVWRALPHEYPPWPTVWTYFRRWRDDGTWQAVQTTERGGLRGYDAGKHILGRKRFLLVDTQGWLIAVWVDAADVPEWDGGREHPRLRHLWVDAGFGEKFAAGVREATGWTVAVVTKVAGQQGFAVQPRRWVVERTLSWLGKQRRLAKDFERLEESTEAWIFLTMIRLMSRQLAQNPC